MNLKSNVFCRLGKFFSTLFFSLAIVLLLQQLFFPVINSLIGLSSSAEARANSSIYGIIYPLNTYYRISSGFGPRWGRNHNGIDLAAPTGTPVYAIQSGKVEIPNNDPNGYGNYVVISHDGFDSLYAHLSKIYVRHQETVQQGYKIGEVGETGNAQGAHLHFEMRNKSWAAFDPAPVLVGAKLPNAIQYPNPNNSFPIAENVPDCLRSNGRGCDKPYKPRQLPSCADAAWGACLRRKIS